METEYSLANQWMFQPFTLSAWLHGDTIIHEEWPCHFLDFSSQKPACNCAKEKHIFIFVYFVYVLAISRKKVHNVFFSTSPTEMWNLCYCCPNSSNCLCCESRHPSVWLGRSAVCHQQRVSTSLDITRLISCSMSCAPWSWWQKYAYQGQLLVDSQRYCRGDEERRTSSSCERECMTHSRSIIAQYTQNAAGYLVRLRQRVKNWGKNTRENSIDYLRLPRTMKR